MGWLKDLACLVGWVRRRLFHFGNGGEIVI